MRLPYDPKLREAAEDFKALCEKYDCAGIVLFVSPTHSEFVNHISPSWSLVKFEAPDRMRFRSKREDFPSKEAQHQATEATTHILTSTAEWARRLQSTMMSVLEQLKPHMRVMWTAWGEPDSYPGDGK
jgi:hypothetical protein